MAKAVLMLRVAHEKRNACLRRMVFLQMFLYVCLKLRAMSAKDRVAEEVSHLATDLETKWRTSGIVVSSGDQVSPPNTISFSWSLSFEPVRACTRQILVSMVVCHSTLRDAAS